MKRCATNSVRPRRIMLAALAVTLICLAPDSGSARVDLEVAPAHGPAFVGQRSTVLEWPPYAATGQFETAATSSKIKRRCRNSGNGGVHGNTKKQKTASSPQTSSRTGSFNKKKLRSRIKTTTRRRRSCTS